MRLPAAGHTLVVAWPPEHGTTLAGPDGWQGAVDEAGTAAGVLVPEPALLLLLATAWCRGGENCNFTVVITCLVEICDLVDIKPLIGTHVTSRSILGIDAEGYLDEGED